MTIYVLIKHFEASIDYGWDYSPTELVRAYTSKVKAEQDKKDFEEENGGETWEEYDEFTCYFTIEEVELEGDVENA